MGVEVRTLGFSVNQASVYISGNVEPKNGSRLISLSKEVVDTVQDER
jgi:hypothetical protein